MQAKFTYEDKHLTVQFRRDETANQVCTKFVNKTFLNINDLHFKIGDKLLIPEEPLIYQLDSQDINQTIEILVVKRDPENEHIVKLYDEGQQKHMILKKGNSLIASVAAFLKKPLKKLGLIVNGEYIGSNSRKTFHQIANTDNKEKNSINIIVDELEDDQQEQEQDKEKKDEEGENIKKHLMKETDDNDENNEEKPTEEIEDEISTKDSWKFFIKLYSYLFVELILIGILTFLGFYYGFDDVFSNSSKAFWWSISTISVFTLICSTIPFCLTESDNAGCCGYFLLIVYIPIMSFYCYLIKRHDGVDIIEGFYIIEQIIIFALDCLFLILSNVIIKGYRGWHNFLILSGINVLAIYICAGPISNNYEIFKFSHKGFVNMSIISSIMIAFILSFNSVISGINKEENETGRALIGALIFDYVPFVFVAILIVFVLFVAILLGLIFIILGIILAIFVVIFVAYILFVFLGGLA